MEEKQLLGAGRGKGGRGAGQVEEVFGIFLLIPNFPKASSRDIKCQQRQGVTEAAVVGRYGWMEPRGRMPLTSQQPPHVSFLGPNGNCCTGTTHVDTRIDPSNDRTMVPTQARSGRRGLGWAGCSTPASGPNDGFCARFAWL